MHPENLQMQVYYAICLVEIGETAEARNQLQSIAIGQSAWRSEARWWIALSYLKEENRAATREELLLIQPNEDRYSHAQNLIRKL